MANKKQNLQQTSRLTNNSYQLNSFIAQIKINPFK